MHQRVNKRVRVRSLRLGRLRDHAVLRKPSAMFLARLNDVRGPCSRGLQLSVRWHIIDSCSDPGLDGWETGCAPACNAAVRLLL
jgi:hypothetical protein